MLSALSFCASLTKSRLLSSFCLPLEFRGFREFDAKVEMSIPYAQHRLAVSNSRSYYGVDTLAGAGT